MSQRVESIWIGIPHIISFHKRHIESFEWEWLGRLAFSACVFQNNFTGLLYSWMNIHVAKWVPVVEWNVNSIKIYMHWYFNEGSHNRISPISENHKIAQPSPKQWYPSPTQKKQPKKQQKPHNHILLKSINGRSHTFQFSLSTLYR